MTKEIDENWMSNWSKLHATNINGLDVYKWNLENIHGAWATNRHLKDAFERKFEDKWIKNGNFPFWFELETDAIAFKLRWL